MQQVHDHSEVNEGIGHPTFNDENIVSSGNAKVEFFKYCLAESLDHLEIPDDPDCAHDQAMKAWDKVFNSDWFRAQPDPDAEKKLDNRMKGGPFIKQGKTRYATGQSGRLA
jgi:hypothetical protein